MAGQAEDRLGSWSVFFIDLTKFHSLYRFIGFRRGVRGEIEVYCAKRSKLNLVAKRVFVNLPFLVSPDGSHSENS